MDMYDEGSPALYLPRHWISTFFPYPNSLTLLSLASACTATMPSQLVYTLHQDRIITSWLFDVPSIYAKLIIAEQTVLANWR
jgi:hypothetical protein